MLDNREDGAVFFASMEPRTRAALIDKGTKKHFAKGQSIYVRGELGDSAFFVRSGRIEISVTSVNGRKSVLNYMEAGDLIGEIALLDGGERSADAVAITEVSGVLVFKDQVVEALMSDGEALMRIVGELCSKVRNASEMFEMQRKASGRARLASIILRIADRWGVSDESGAIYLGNNYTQSELGDFAGLSRENVNRYLTNWITEGVLEQRADDKRLYIVEREKLEDLAG